MDDRVKKTLALINTTKKTILDIGCNEGGISEMLANKGHNVVGIDICQRAIDIAKTRRRDNLKFICGDILKTEMPRFDTILFLETIEHIDNPNYYLSRIKELLKDDGELIISTPNSIGL